jgi:hypothetical protein
MQALIGVIALAPAYILLISVIGAILVRRDQRIARERLARFTKFDWLGAYDRVVLARRLNSEFEARHWQSDGMNYRWDPPEYEMIHRFIYDGYLRLEINLEIQARELGLPRPEFHDRPQYENWIEWSQKKLARRAEGSES